jgi:lipoteichoic acid synthase
MRFGFSLWFPIGLFCVLLKIHWTHVTAPDATWIVYLDAIRPEIFLYAGMVLCTSTVMDRLVHLRTRKIVSIGIAVVALGLFLLELVCYFFFTITGALVTIGMLSFVVSHLVETWLIIMKIVPVLSVLGTALPFIWVTFVMVKIQPWQRGSPPTKRQHWQLARKGLTGLTLVCLSVPLPFSFSETGQGREVVAHMLMTEVHKRHLPKVVRMAGEPWGEVTLKNEELSPWKNVVVIWLESTRYDVTDGTQDPSFIPNWKALAENSLVADKAWTVVPHSTKSTISIFCGIPPPLDMHHSQSYVLPSRCFPELLREKGYATLMMRSGTRHFENWPRYINNIGFEEFLAFEDMDTSGFSKVNYFGYEDDILLEPARTWLTDRGDDPFLITYMTGTSHHNYGLPTGFESVQLDNDPHKNAYLNSIRYTDLFLGKVIALHKELGLYENTLFVVLGDHGEAFGEHGRYQHDGVPYQEVVHIPMLFHAPGAFVGGQHIDALVSQLNVMPTIADLLGYTVVSLDRPANSLLALSSPKPVLVSCYYADTCSAIMDGPWKFIHHHGQRTDELFRIDIDPQERDNLANEYPKRAADMRATVLQWIVDTQARYAATEAASFSE